MKLINYLILLILCFFINTSFADSKKSPVVCTQEYALCTAAPCIPDPKNSELSICFCVVKNGDSVGYKSCAKRAAEQGPLKVKKLISTFSFKQFVTKKNMRCSRGKPWADCLDAPCTVNPRHPKRAICSCKMNSNQDFITLGGKCDTNTCSTGFWSGSTVSDAKVLRKSLLEKMGTTLDPSANAVCPTPQP